MTTTSAFCSLFADAKVFAIYRPSSRDRQHECLGRYRSWSTVARILADWHTAYAVVDGVIIARSTDTRSQLRRVS